jgi:hypothetical protein
MSKLAVSVTGAALGGIVLGIGIMMALFPPPTSPPEPTTAPAPRPEPSRHVEPGSSLPPESSGRTKTTATATPDKPTATGTGAPLGDAVAALRKAGVSDVMIAEFVAAQAQAQRRERQRDLLAKIARGEADPELRNSMLYGANVERDQLIRSLVGDEAFRQWDKQNYQDRLGALRLSPEEYDAWYTLQKQHEARTLETSLRHAAGEIDGTENSEQVRALIAEQDQKLRELWGADRFAQYKAGMYGGFTGNPRWYLRDLKLGDSQFDALARADATFAQQNAELMERSRTSGSGGDYMKLTQAVRDARDAEYQRVLGPAGWTEYQKQNDYQYRQMLKYATAWQLSKADADYVYETQRQYRQAVQDAAKDPAGYATRAVEIRALGQQAAQYLQNYLGADRYAKLKKSSAIGLPSTP